MLKALYDEEYLREIHLKRLIRETTEEVTEKVTEEVTEAVTSKVTDKHIRSVVEMLETMGMDRADMIANLMHTFEIDEEKAISYIEKR